jgi:hypothetical protein
MLEKVCHICGCVGCSEGNCCDHTATLHGEFKCEECSAAVDPYETLCSICTDEANGLSEFLKPMKDDPVKGWAKLLKKMGEESKNEIVK